MQFTVVMILGFLLLNQIGSSNKKLKLDWESHLDFKESTTMAILFEKELPTNARVQVYINLPGNPTNFPVETKINNPYVITFQTFGWQSIFNRQLSPHHSQSIIQSTVINYQPQVFNQKQSTLTSFVIHRTRRGRCYGESDGEQWWRCPWAQHTHLLVTVNGGKHSLPVLHRTSGTPCQEVAEPQRWPWFVGWANVLHLFFHSHSSSGFWTHLRFDSGIWICQAVGRFPSFLTFVLAG